MSEKSIYDLKPKNEFEEKVSKIIVALNKNRPNSFAYNNDQPFDILVPTNFNGLFWEMPSISTTRADVEQKICDFLEISMDSFKYRFIVDNVWNKSVYLGIKIATNSLIEIQSRLIELGSGYEPVDPRVEVIMRNVKESENKFINLGGNKSYQKSSIESIDFSTAKGSIFFEESGSDYTHKYRVEIPKTTITLGSGKELILHYDKPDIDSTFKFDELRVSLCIKAVLTSAEIGNYDYTFIREYFKPYKYD